MNAGFDAILLVSFGGPEGPADVIPFLENVLRGKNVPRERLLEVADHYQQFGGVSPINEQNRRLIAALEQELERRGPKLPIYWGNRNWSPLLPETVKQMKEDGVRRALAIVTSAFSSYSGCRQYLENIADARSQVDGAPTIERIRVFFNHPSFVDVNAHHVREALARIPPARRDDAMLLFTAHSIPLSMSDTCQYVQQLREHSRLVAESVGATRWALVYQSRSGPPAQPWLEPDVNDFIREQHAAGSLTDALIAPIGFISDHVEVKFDLDTEARQTCAELGVGFQRAATAGVHPLFISMLRDLIAERVESLDSRPTIGEIGPCPDVCDTDCCPRPPARPH